MMNIKIVIFSLLLILSQVQSRTKQCYQRCNDEFVCNKDLESYELCQERAEYCPPTCQDLIDVRLISECLGDCYYDNVNNCPEIGKYIRCIDDCEREIKPYEMTKKELAEFKKEVKKDPYLHPGSTFTQPDCDPEKRKIAFVTMGHTGSSVANYFDTRCDYQLIFVKYLDQRTSFDFRWQTYFRDIDFDAFDPETQIVNHIRGFSDAVSAKDTIVFALQDFDKKKLYNFNSEQFHFQNYFFNLNSSEYNEEEKYFFENVNDGLWLSKKPVASMGLYITLFKNVQEVKDNIRKLKSGEMKLEYHLEQFGVIQQYMHNPLLIDGKKNDMRNYIVIASMEPLVVLYQHGFVRTCIEKYDNNEFEEFDAETAFRHLTNSSFAEAHPDYDMKKQQLLVIFEQYEKMLMEEYNITKEFIEEKIYKEIKKISAYTVLAGLDKVEKVKGTFQFIGADFIVDEDFNTKIIEVNVSAALYNNLLGHKTVIPQLVQTILDVLLYTLSDPNTVHEKWAHPEQLDLGKWEILINEATGYNILDEYKN